VKEKKNGILRFGLLRAMKCEQFFNMTLLNLSICWG